MDPSEQVCKSLMIWVKTLTSVPDELYDGVAISEILKQISPLHFATLVPKMVLNPGSNRRLKMSNLKKIVESVVDYYQDVLNLNILDNGKPDTYKIAESSDRLALVELGKLLRLILGCAVNCERKQEYITQIMDLEESVQRNIMIAIQELEVVTGNTGRSGLSLLSMENADARLCKLMSDLEAANESKEMSEQKCLDLEIQVHRLLEEKQTLLNDNLLLIDRLEHKDDDKRYGRSSPSTTPSSSSSSSDNRRQVDLLREEMYKLETARDDYCAKVEQLEKQLVILQEKNSELAIAAETASRLKDEVDALSESADKVQVLENTISSYKKKLEDYADAKKQLKSVETKNIDYYQQILKYEEEIKSMSIWKGQYEVYKKRADDLQQQLDEETRKVDEISFQFKTAEAKLIALTGENERAVSERDKLREEIEEFKCGKRVGMERECGGATMDVAREMTPTELMERLGYLEKENKRLQSANHEALSRKALLEDATKRIEKLTERNRSVNKRVLELEAQLQESCKKNSPDVRQTELVKDDKHKIATLQESLAAKDAELHNLQTKYDKSLEKAREVARMLERKEKQQHCAPFRTNSSGMKESEQQLIATAFHKLALNKHREAVDEHLAVLNAGQGQSFLSRQRQPLPRKPVQSFKSK